MYKIYILIDPLTKQIRYVGRTNMTLHRRLTKHISDIISKNSHKVNWIKSLSRKNLKPIITIVEDNIELIEDANIAEVQYIKHLKLMSCELTNSTEGGGGALGYKHSPKSIKKLKKLSHPHTEETKQMLSKIKIEFYKQKSIIHEIDNLIFEFKKNNPKISNRKIAKFFNINDMKVGRVLKKYSKN